MFGKKIVIIILIVNFTLDVATYCLCCDDMDSGVIYFKTSLQVWMVKELKINLLCLNLRMDNLYSLKMVLLHTFLHLTKVSIEIFINTTHSKIRFFFTNVYE